MFLGVIATCGCYHVRVIVPQPDPGTEYKKKTVQNLAWGALPKKDRDVPASNCLNFTGLDEVRVSSNLGYSFLTVGTLGFWSPAQIEWRCTKPHDAPSNPIHKKKPVSFTLIAASQAGSPKLSGKETIHTIAWGLVARNAVSKCADSRSMDDVRVSSNLGYHFLTLATLGFWSPTNVEWTCSRFQEQSGMLNRNPLFPSQGSLESR
ncbi:MAG TPA: hypothetical protein VHW72_00630 [Candidatus Angelobacter sp.]|nr:hypothetical protein [Candidatus Angelobacter sp.]